MMKNIMAAITPIGNDIVRNNTAERINAEIDRQTAANLAHFGSQSETVIRARMEQLDKEWDIERTLELNAATIAFAGVLLSATMGKKWLLLPAIVTGFLAQHAIQGWCPPLPVFRYFGIRTRKEIDQEKQALQEILEQRNAHQMVD